MKSLVSIAAFMKKNIKAFRGYSKSDMLNWANWHASNKSLAYVEKDGKVIAAGSARQINQAILGLMSDEIKTIRDIAYYMNDPQGEICYSDQAACKDSKAFFSLLVAMRARFPTAKTFIFKKSKSMTKLKSYSFEKFMNKAQQVNRLERQG